MLRGELGVEAFDEFVELGIVARRQAQQRNLAIAGRSEGGPGGFDDLLHGPHANGQTREARLAEPTTVGTTSHDFEHDAFVNALAHRHERGRDGRRLAHRSDVGVLDTGRHIISQGSQPRVAAVGVILRLVESRRVGRRDLLGGGEDNLLSPGVGGLHRSNDFHQFAQGLLAVADEEDIHEVGQRLGAVGQGIPADDDRIILAPVGRPQGDAREVQHGQHVRGEHLVGEREADDIEVADGGATLPAEQGNRFLAHDGLGVDLRTVGPVAGHAREAVEPVIEQLATQMADADRVGVRKHHRDSDLGGVDIVAAGVGFQADVLARLADARQERLADCLAKITHRANRSNCLW